MRKCEPQPQPSWERRFVVLSANVLYVFTSGECVQPPVKSPLFVACVEDCSYENRPISDEEVARSPDIWSCSDHAFELVPPHASSVGHGHRFCAETAVLRSRWAASIKRCTSLALREEVRNLRTELECKEIELRELKRVLAETLVVPGGGGEGARSGGGNGGISWATPQATEQSVPSSISSKYSAEELGEASRKLQAAARGRLIRQQSANGTGKFAGKPPRKQSIIGVVGGGLKSMANGTTGGLKSMAHGVAGGLSASTAAVGSATAAVSSVVGSAVVAVMEAGNTDASPATQTPTPTPPPPPPPQPLPLQAASGERGPDANGAAHEAMAALHERGEKLAQLGAATENLTADAESFAEQAKRLKQQAQRRSMLGGWF